MNITSWAGLVGSSLKHIFHWNALSCILRSCYLAQRTLYWHVFHLERVCSSAISHPTSHLYKPRKKEVPKYILVEHLKWFLSKKSLDHLIAPLVFKILKNLLKHLKGFHIYHYGLISELTLHAKLYRRRSICLKTLLLHQWFSIKNIVDLVE